MQGSFLIKVVFIWVWYFSDHAWYLLDSIMKRDFLLLTIYGISLVPYLIESKQALKNVSLSSCAVF